MIETEQSPTTVQFPRWDELTRREQLISEISDDYKSLNGFRPRFNPSDYTDDELAQWHHQILTDLKAEVESEMFTIAETNRRMAMATSREPWTLGDLMEIIL